MNAHNFGMEDLIIKRIGLKIVNTVLCCLNNVKMCQVIGLCNNVCSYMHVYNYTCPRQLLYIIALVYTMHKTIFDFTFKVLYMYYWSSYICTHFTCTFTVDSLLFYSQSSLCSSTSMVTAITHCACLENVTTTVSLENVHSHHIHHVTLSLMDD